MLSGNGKSLSRAFQEGAGPSSQARGHFGLKKVLFVLMPLCFQTCVRQDHHLRGLGKGSPEMGVMFRGEKAVPSEGNQPGDGLKKSSSRIGVSCSRMACSQESCASLSEPSMLPRIPWLPTEEQTLKSKDSGRSQESVTI